MRKQLQSAYRTMDNGVILSNQDGQDFRTKPEICQQILKLRYAQISEAFNGVKGSQYLEAIRYAMVAELDACVHQLSSWREIAQMVKGRTDHVYH